MKNFIKHSAFFVFITFSLVFISCESNEDTQLIEEQSNQLILDSNKYTSVKTLTGRSEIYTYNTITLKGNNGKYLSTEGGNKSMTCVNSHAGNWEKFDIINFPANSDTYILRGSNDKYVRVKSGSELQCNRDYADHATKFRLYGSKQSIALARGAYWTPYYLSSENGSKPVRWNRRLNYSWEKWTMADALW